MTRSFRLNLLALAVASCFGGAHANPTGGQVVAGQANFVANGNLLTITNSANAIINWQTFSIGRNETTRFVQVDANSAVLNRVLGNNPSLLLGQLQSNGRVFLVNPAGLLVGQGAKIDVAGFVASTLNLSDANFLAGKLAFAKTPGAAPLVNQGSIRTTDGGQVFLVAPQVVNSGSIVAADGKVVLAAGERVEIGDTALPGLKVEVVGDGSADNLGKVLASAGKVGIVGALVRNAGTVDVSSVEREGGRIFLRAGKAATVTSGELLANGRQGGEIRVEGEQVAVEGKALLDASGRLGGGKVLVGGDFQGSNPAVRNASQTRVAAAAVLRADATENGDGGKVIVWSDGTTVAAGQLSARGGALGGNGGLIETSGKQRLVFAARADTRAPAGKTGTLLLDPTDITIVAGSSVRNLSSVDTIGSPESSTVYWNDIVDALSQNNVVIQTSSNGAGLGDIVVANGQTFASANKLSLLAENNLTVNAGANVENTGSGGLQFVAGWNPASGESVPLANNTRTTGSMTINGSVQTQGAIDLAAKGDLVLNALVKSGAGPVTVSAGGNLAINLPAGASNEYVDDQYFLYVFPNNFSFTFYGVTYDRAYISSNGLITFGSGTGAYSDSTARLGSLGMPVIASSWNDWEINTSLRQSIEITRPTSNELAVKWDVGQYPQTGRSAVFETVLNRQSGNIGFNYGATGTNFDTTHPSYASDVTIGIARGDGSSQISGLMNLPNFSMHYLKSTTFAPGANGYVETIAATGGNLASRGAVLYSSDQGFSFNNTNIAAYTTLQAATQLALNVGGRISGYGGITTPRLDVSAGSGVSLGGAYNEVGAMTASVKSGGLSFNNHRYDASGDFELLWTKVGGDLDVTNYGATKVGTVAPGIRASGAITIVANSPLTVGAAGITGSGTGDVGLAANNAGDLTLTGPVASGGTTYLVGGTVSGADIYAPGAIINGQSSRPNVPQQTLQAPQQSLIAALPSAGLQAPPVPGAGASIGPGIPPLYFSSPPEPQPGATLQGGTIGGGSGEFGGQTNNSSDFLIQDDNHGQNAFSSQRFAQCN